MSFRTGPCLSPRIKGNKDMQELAKAVVESMTELKLTLGSCESMTAGLFGATVCSIPGASKVYLGGLITYDPQQKVSLADVEPETIKEYGVVSTEVATEMARGAGEVLGVDVCVSVTGNAGPTAQEGAEVGDVCIGLYYKGQVSSYMLNFSGDRNEIREKAVATMLQFVLTATKFQDF